MLDFRHNAKRIGFSTGALEKGDFKRAIKWLQMKRVRSIELSALRIEELAPMVNALDSLPIADFHYVSFHAPSFFPQEAESGVVQLLRKVASRGWNIVVHPDVIRNHLLWKQFGSHLLIENMDRRKFVGRTADELDRIFKLLPNARMCLDVAHARQMDTTLNLLSQIIGRFSARIAEIHISELDSWYQHQPMSAGAVTDYQIFASHFSASLPVIIESMLGGSRAPLRIAELHLAWTAMQRSKNTNNGKPPRIRMRLHQTGRVRQKLFRRTKSTR